MQTNDNRSLSLIRFRADFSAQAMVQGLLTGWGVHLVFRMTAKS